MGAVGQIFRPVEIGGDKLVATFFQFCNQGFGRFFHGSRQRLPGFAQLPTEAVQGIRKVGKCLLTGFGGKEDAQSQASTQACQQADQWFRIHGLEES